LQRMRSVSLLSAAYLASLEKSRANKDRLLVREREPD
jgi:hypothetical protein